MVALSHFRTASALDAVALVHNAWLFVDFFFVLSGFVIAAAYQARLAAGFEIGAFMLLRLGRLYPLHVAMLVAFVVAEVALALGGSGVAGTARGTFAGQTAPVAILTNLALVSGIGFHEGLTWNGVAWSISTEFWTYLVFAVVALALSRMPALVGLVVAAPGIAIVLCGHAAPEMLARFVDFGRCLYGFGIGCFTYRLFGMIEARRRRSALSSAVASFAEGGAMMFALAPFLALGVLPNHVLTPLFFAPAVLVFAFDSGAASALLNTRPFVFVGALSYSIYMIHPFVQARIMQPAALVAQKIFELDLLHSGIRDGAAVPVWGGASAAGAVLALLMLVLVVGFSILSYRWIEAPGRAAMRRFVAGRRRPVAGIGAA